MKAGRRRVTPVRVQKELKMIRRIVILVIGLISFPYAIFIFLSFFNRIPKIKRNFDIIFRLKEILKIKMILLCLIVVENLSRNRKKEKKKRIIMVFEEFSNIIN